MVNSDQQLAVSKSLYANRYQLFALYKEMNIISPWHLAMTH